MTAEQMRPQQDGLKNEELGQAPKGTYDMLKSLLGGKNLRVWGTARHKTFIHVSIEPVCAETGESCMNLLIRQRPTAKEDHIGFHAHITNEDAIARLSASTLNKEKGEGNNNSTPELETVLKILKESQDRLPTTTWQ